MTGWTPTLPQDNTPHYLAIASSIANDIQSGRLAYGQRLPPQRILARQLDIHFTTIARGYVEAQKRGLIESKVGHGTFVCVHPPSRRQAQRQPVRPVDLTMNLPPETADPDLLDRMRCGMESVAADIAAVMRYQGFGGSDSDKQAALSWLQRHGLTPPGERLLVTPGTHPTILGILTALARTGDAILCERITYPGIRAITAQLGLELVGLEMDDHGIDPGAFDDACKTRNPKALYLNPNLKNPTTLTIPVERRREIVAIARKYNVPIIEDDAYGFIVPRNSYIVPFAALAPELTWHIAGLSKCLGAGLRAAYVIPPDNRSIWAFTSALRAFTIMASPLTVGLATQWINDGTATMIVRAIRLEMAERQKLARTSLPVGSFKGNLLSFSIWLTLPEMWARSVFVEHLRATGIGVVASDAFVTQGPAPEAVRVCIGGPATRFQIKGALEYIAHAMVQPHASVSTII